jgi:hypothetical protein
MLSVKWLVALVAVLAVLLDVTTGPVPPGVIWASIVLLGAVVLR